MNQQLALGIRSYLNYAPREFVLHQGVREFVTECMAAATSDIFKSFYVYSPPRTGRTHLAIYLADRLRADGQYPRLLEGAELADKIGELNARESSEVLIVDDAQLYLEQIRAGESGPLVRLFEGYRVVGATIVLFSSRRLETFDYDDHVRSRIASGVGDYIKMPAEIDLKDLIAAMARQRGVRLSEKKLIFLSGRLDRSVPAIEEYLEKLVYLARVLGKNIDFPLLADAL